VALIWGVGVPGTGHAGGDTVEGNFGPFNIGPRWWNGGVGGQLEISGEDDANVGCG